MHTHKHTHKQAHTHTHTSTHFKVGPEYMKDYVGHKVSRTHPISFPRMRVELRMGGVGTSLVVQWLGLSASTARSWVQSLVRELKSHKLRGAAKKKKKKRLGGVKQL